MRKLLGGVVLALAVAVATQAASADDTTPASTDPGARAARRVPDYRLLQLDGHQVKWGASQLGIGAKVRYALLPAAMDFGATRNCRGLRPLDDLLQSSGIDHGQAAKEIAAAFAMWERAANINFQMVEHPAVADILIGAQADPKGRAFTEVIYDRSGITAAAAPGVMSPPDARTTPGPIRRIDKALICLNPERSWKVGFGGDVDIYDLRYTVAHEIGHAIGLDHPGPSGQVMGFAYEEQFRVLQPGDLAGAIAIYGRRGSPVAKTPAAAGKGNGAGESPVMALE